MNSKYMQYPSIINLRSTCQFQSTCLNVPGKSDQWKYGKKTSIDRPYFMQHPIA